MGAARGQARGALPALLLAVLVAGVLSPVLANEFLDYDDDVYVTENPQVRRGLSLAGARWALTSTEAANWFPLTRLSHQADVAWHGLDPRGHHLTNLALHAANSALLFALLRALTGALWPSLFAAALFGLHPLHVEPVAWVAERKELLALLLGLLTLVAYRRYASRPGPGRLVPVALLLALALMAKPVVVTLPFVMLLLDYWPLGRLRGPGGARVLGRLVAEKLPLLALAAAASWLTLLAQGRSGATAMTAVAFPVRAVNAVVSCARYLGKTVWPARLSFFYPHPDGFWPAGAALGALALLVAVSVLAWRERRRRPWLGTGWLWYLGTLVPMLGLVQAGWQAMADRYAYLPLIGIFTAAAWAGSQLAASGRGRRLAVAAAGIAALAACAVLARAQAAVWHDSESLYAHAVAVDGDNWLARQNLGSRLIEAGKPAAALPHLEAAVRLRPGHAKAWYNLGGALYALGRHPEAIKVYEQTVALDPGYADAWANLGASHYALGNLGEALAASDRALALRPGHPAATRNREAAGRLFDAARRR